MKQYAYGIDNLLTTIGYLNAVNPTADVSFGHDPFFTRLAAMTDGTGITTYSYYPSFTNGAQNLQNECFTASSEVGCSHEIGYVYDALARLSSRAVSGSDPETFTYDAIGRITGHATAIGDFNLSYRGQTHQMIARYLQTSGSTLKTTWSYLPNINDRRLAGIANTGLVAGQYTNFSFETSPENQITGITQTSELSVLAVDPTTQLVSFNVLNQIGEVSGQAYIYDANGNLLSDGEHSYTWDAEDRLTAVSYASETGKQTRFAYDGLGRRTTITETPAGGGSAVTSHYVWCGTGPCQKRDANYGLARAYFTEGEYRIGMLPAPELYYGVDQLGSVRRVFESAANAPAYDYDAWGNTLQTTTLLTDYGFAGLFNHPESNIRLAWFRAYEPNAGRWLSRDPLGEPNKKLANLYTYTDNSPLNYTDRLGLESQSLPMEGPPGGSLCLPGRQIRVYNQCGGAFCDIDLNHDHGSGSPHLHFWGTGGRGPGLPLPSQYR